MRNKKILHLIYNLGVGGTEKMMLNTLPRLSDFNHIICVINEVNPIMAREFAAKNIPVVGLNGLKIFHFQKIIKKENPDILATYLIYSDLFGRIFGRIFGIKKIITSLRSSYAEPRFKLWLLLEKITSPLVDCYISVSETVKNIYEKSVGIPGEKIEIIYNGVDISKFDIQIDKKTKRQEIGLPEHALIIGCIGKFRPEKGQKYLIWAMPEILQKFPDAVLALVGDGEEKEKLDKLIKSLELEQSVKLFGERQDVPEILKTFDVFVNPSLYEGMSNSILEAMAAKIPIAASDIPSNAEIIENGKTGLLMPVMNIEKIAESVIQILSSPELAKKLSSAAFQKVQNFTIEKTIEKLNVFFHQAVQHPISS